MFDHDYKKYPELTNKEIDEFGFSSPHKQYTENFIADVVEVHDGDTINLRTGDRDFDFSLRFAKVDTKELGSGGEEARDWLKGLIENKKVEIVIDKENRVDKYGRLLGDVMYAGQSVAEQMMHLGLALPFGSRNDGKIPAHQKDMDFDAIIGA